jgi:DNA-binding XRE family transcriptional regulator
MKLFMVNINYNFLLLLILLEKCKTANAIFRWRYIMLALVKKPRIEISLHGEKLDELIEWIAKKFEINILTSDESESIDIEETDFWKEMQSNRIGNLLAGARLKANLSQVQLAQKLGVRQNMISDYERGKRRLSPAMAERIAGILNIKESYILD